MFCFKDGLALKHPHNCKKVNFAAAATAISYFIAFVLNIIEERGKYYFVVVLWSV